MSSKKASRRERKRKQRELREGGGRNPVRLFVVGIGLVIVLLVAAALVLGNREGREDPPWPGAVWSPEHGHWH